jgi:hypothetical protein
MPKNTMVDLRDHLFATIEDLRDTDKPMELERARAVCEVAGKIIETGKMEVAAGRLMLDASRDDLTAGVSTGFFEQPKRLGSGDLKRGGKAA